MEAIISFIQQTSLAHEHSHSSLWLQLMLKNTRSRTDVQFCRGFFEVARMSTSATV